MFKVIALFVFLGITTLQGACFKKNPSLDNLKIITGPFILERYRASKRTGPKTIQDIGKRSVRFKVDEEEVAQREGYYKIAQAFGKDDQKKIKDIGKIIGEFELDESREKRLINAITQIPWIQDLIVDCIQDPSKGKGSKAILKAAKSTINTEV